MKKHYSRTILLSMAVGFAWLCAGYTTAAAVNDIVAGVERELPRNCGRQVLKLPKTSAATALSAFCETAKGQQ